MNHLTDKTLFEYVDNRLAEGRKVETERHLLECDQCRTALRLERSMRRVVGSAPVIKAPAGLSSLVMVNIGKGQDTSRAFRILSSVGNAAAMAIVLGVIGLAIVFGSDVKLKPAEASSSLTTLVAPVTEIYAQWIHGLNSGTTLLTQTLGASSAPQVWSIILFVLFTFAVLAAVDKLFGKRLTRLRS